MSAFAPDFPLPDGYLWQYELLRWIQTFASPHVDQVMKYISLFGNDDLFFVLLPLIFWCLSRTIGLRIAYVFLASMYTNEWLKDWFSIVRPIGVPGIRSIYTSSANGIYSLPSGHAQGSMTFLFLLGKWMKKAWLWVLLFAVTLAIGISRLYLGLHWPVDPLVGWGLGLLFGIFGWLIGQWWTYRTYTYKIRMWVAVLLPVLLMVLHRGDTSLSYATLLLTVGVGCMLEEKYVCSQMEHSVWKRLCAGVIGIAGLIALKWFIPWPFDNTLFFVLEYGLIGLWTTLGAPYIFLKCGLYQRGELSAS